jgi:hypothetical protein
MSVGGQLSFHLGSKATGPKTIEGRERILAQWPKDKEPELFEDLDEETRRKLNRELERLSLYEHAFRAD